jgi:arginine/lysine/ornithine decarboxylase
LSPSRHPIDAGADVCCDSAHKTLPALTGGAYLHLSKHAPKSLINQAKTALATFGSTSPSYLTLCSLDAANAYLSGGYRERLARFVIAKNNCEKTLTDHGYTLLGDEPLKLTLHAAKFGYTGREMADLLLRKGIVCEFSDREVLVMMLTPEQGESALDALTEALCAIERRAALIDTPPALPAHERVKSVREAMLAPSEWVPVEQCLGRVVSSPTLSCPPAVPIAVPGERINEQTVKCMQYYGMGKCCVVKE